MEILVYRKGSHRIQENLTAADLPELLEDTGAVIWVDMESPTEADEQILLDVFHFHPLTVEDCRENRHYPKVEEFEGYLYFIVHGVTADTSSERFNTIELDGFLGSNYVITYHHDHFRSIANVKQLLRTSPVACQRGTAFLLHQILDRGVVGNHSREVLLDQLRIEIDVEECGKPRLLRPIENPERGCLAARESGQFL